jgi:hypothetical protein
MGQAAFLSKNFSAVSMSFYASIPGTFIERMNYSCAHSGWEILHDESHLVHPLGYNMPWIVIPGFLLSLFHVHINNN